MVPKAQIPCSTYDKVFLPAQKTRRLVQQDFDRVFIQSNLLSHKSSAVENGVHVILTPCAMSSAPTIEDCLPDSDKREDDDTDKHTGAVDSYVNDVMTIPASLAGIPAISVPFGKSEGLPVGLQLLGQYGYDRFLLEIANKLSKST